MARRIRQLRRAVITLLLRNKIAPEPPEPGEAGSPMGLLLILTYAGE